MLNKKRLKNKLSVLLTAPTFLLKGLIEFLLPAFSILFIYIFKEEYIDKLNNTTILYHFLTLALYLFILLYIVQILVFSIDKLSKFTKTLFYLNATVQLFLFTFSIGYILKNHFEIGNSVIFSIIAITEIITCLLLSLIYSKSLIKTFLKISIPFFVLKPIMSLQLRTYSFCNFHDISWGTKGLKRDKEKEQLFGFIKTITNFRFIFLTIWVAANIIAISFFIGVELDFKLKIFNSVLYSIAILTLLRVLGGAIVFIRNLKK